MALIGKVKRVYADPDDPGTIRADVEITVAPPPRNVAVSMMNVQTASVMGDGRGRALVEVFCKKGDVKQNAKKAARCGCPPARDDLYCQRCMRVLCLAAERIDRETQSFVDNIGALLSQDDTGACWDAYEQSLLLAVDAALEEHLPADKCMAMAMRAQVIE